MHPFEELIYERFSQAIGSWDVIRHPDIYAISLLIDSVWTADEQGNEIALQGELSLSYNTLSHFNEQVENASSTAEARWNFAYWLQNISATVPRFLEPTYGTIPDRAEVTLRDEWCASRNIPVTGADDAGNPMYGEGFEAAIASACAKVVRRLHESQTIVGRIGRTVPVIIHSLEYDRPGMVATRAANSPDAVREFFTEWGVEPE